MNNQPNKKIYFDDDCTFCNEFICDVKNNNNSKNLDFVGINNNQVLPENISKEDLMKEIHFVDENGVVYKNVDALIQIFKNNNQYAFFVKLSGISLIKNVFKFFYKIFANLRHTNLSRIEILKYVIVLEMFSGVLMSINLWTNIRSFPVVPVVENLDFINNFQLILWPLLLISLLGVLISNKLLYVLIPTLFIYILGDQIRLQPWVYQYLIMFSILFFYTYLRKSKELKNENQYKILTLFRIILGGIYFFSGLQKLNSNFIFEVFPWMIGPITNIIPFNLSNLWLVFGFIVPFVEMFIGINLFSNKNRKLALSLAVLMHIFILVVLGPLGHSWNSVVWSWNISMIFLCLLLFYKVSNFSFLDVKNVFKDHFAKIIIILFLIMPFLSFLNLWDSYLSSSLYSGNTYQGEIYISRQVKENLPKDIGKYTTTFKDNEFQLNINIWSFGELNVPVYPEIRVYKKILRDICLFSLDKNDMTLIVKDKELNSKSYIYTCSSI